MKKAWTLFILLIPVEEVSHFTKLMHSYQKWAHEFCKPTIVVMISLEER